MARVGQIHERGAGGVGTRLHRFRCILGSHGGFAPPAMAVGQRIQGGGSSEAGSSLILHCDRGVRVGVHDQPDRFAGELIGHFKEATLVRDRAVLTHQALDTMLEDYIEFRGEQSQQADMGEILLVALQRRATGEAGVRAAVVDLLCPRPQPRVQIFQGEWSRVQLTQELGTCCTMPSFQLSLRKSSQLHLIRPMERTLSG